ncbi:hypothetical protein [Reichenbachiella sp.]|uniref:hypothetical protein n=1 Tax=Reichenbachiella sp. TaxID=2184521 RepID=UPI0032992E1B
MERKHRFYIVSGIFYGIFGLILLIVRQDIAHNFLGTDNTLTILTASITLILIGIGSILFVYLQGGFSKKIFPNELESDNRRLLKELRNLRNEFTHKLESQEFDKTELRNAIEERVSEITSTTVLDKIKKEFNKEILNETKFSNIQEELDDIKYRIEKEIARLSRNGNLNLTIGFVTTFMAIFFLGYSVLSIQNVDGTYDDFLYSFIPRVTLSVFIEIFSFFFLRIYKNNLEDIKYFNNERTNIDLKLLALKTAYYRDDNELTKSVVSELSKTERNFTLKKGESTVDIEKLKFDSSQKHDVLSSILKIIEKK